jgi:hypothetical protein
MILAVVAVSTMTMATLAVFATTTTIVDVFSSVLPIIPYFVVLPFGVLFLRIYYKR